MSALEKATENYRRRVGAQIRTARDEAELTLDQLAEKTFSSRQHLIKLERGDHSPTKRMLSAIALATGKDISFFNGEKDEGEEDDEEADPPMSLDDYLRLRARKILREERRAAGL